MRRPSPALVVSIVALVVSLCGTSYAALQITGKNVKNRSLTGKDIKRNSLGGAEIREARLAKVPRAGNADRATRADRATQADRAATAANATKLAGRGPEAFAPASQDFRGFATAASGQTKTVVARGPFKVELHCATSYGGNPPTTRNRAQVVVRASEPIRSSEQSVQGEPATGVATVAAGQPLYVVQTGLAGPGEGAAAVGGGYFDAAGGRTLDVSARGRVGVLGQSACSAVVHATFIGL